MVLVGVDGEGQVAIFDMCGSENCYLFAMSCFFLFCASKHAGHGPRAEAPRHPDWRICCLKIDGALDYVFTLCRIAKEDIYMIIPQLNTD